MPMMPPRPYPPAPKLERIKRKTNGTAGRKPTANPGSPLAAAQRSIISSYAGGVTRGKAGASSKGKQTIAGITKGDANKSTRPTRGVGSTGRGSASKSTPVSRAALPPTPNRGSRPSATRPTRGGGSFAGDLAEFGRAVNRGKAGASSKGKQIAGRMAAEGTRAQKARPVRGGGSKAKDGAKAMGKLGGYLAATDVSGKGRSAAAGRRRADLAGFVGQSGRKAANTGPKKRLPKTM